MFRENEKSQDSKDPVAECKRNIFESQNLKYLTHLHMKFNEDNQGSLPKIIILNEPIVYAALTTKKDLYER